MTLHHWVLGSPTFWDRSRWSPRWDHYTALKHWEPNMKWHWVIYQNNGCLKETPIQDIWDKNWVLPNWNWVHLHCYNLSDFTMNKSTVLCSITLSSCVLVDFSFISVCRVPACNLESTCILFSRILRLSTSFCKRSFNAWNDAEKLL